MVSRWLAISQNVVFNRGLHMKNKIATVLKITKTKIKQSYELRKFHTSRGENEQLQKTSGAYVLSSRKKNQKSLMGGGCGGGGGGNHPPCTSEGWNGSRKLTTAGKVKLNHLMLLLAY